jgi:small subunit ribosomal protein S20
MPISRSAKKSLRKSITNRKDNVSLKNKFKEMVKKFLAKPSQKGMEEAQSMLDKAVKKGILHKNKVARMKSQMSKKIGTEGVKVVVKKSAKKTVVKKTVKRAVKDKMSK